MLNTDEIGKSIQKDNQDNSSWERLPRFFPLFSDKIILHEKQKVNICNSLELLNDIRCAQLDTLPPVVSISFITHRGYNPRKFDTICHLFPTLNIFEHCNQTRNMPTPVEHPAKQKMLLHVLEDWEIKFPIGKIGIKTGKREFEY